VHRALVAAKQYKFTKPKPSFGNLDNRFCLSLRIEKISLAKVELKLTGRDTLLKVTFKTNDINVRSTRLLSFLIERVQGASPSVAGASNDSINLERSKTSRLYTKSTHRISAPLYAGISNDRLKLDCLL
jgi:hypothetical protein